MTGQLRCEHGEWKPRASFSKNQLSKYDRNASATPSRTGIRCTEHSSKPSLEEKCQGPCDRWRDKGFFSKNTVRNGTYWCVDCVDWQLRTENGEALPAPGGQLSVEETNHGAVIPAHLEDDELASVNDFSTFFEDDEISPAFNAHFEAESDDDNSDPSSTLPPSEQQFGATESINERDTISYGDRLDRVIPPSLRHLPTRAPHWLIPDMGGLPTGALRSSTFTVDSPSVGSSAMSVSARGGQDQGIPYNAWGPNGEYARLIKTPTVASSTTRRAETTRPKRQPVKESKSGWARVPTRKHAPQLPDYLKGDMPMAGHDDKDGLDLDSDDDIIRLN